MSLRLYLDDCIFSHTLRRLLQAAGHDVQIPADVTPPLVGADDADHFAHARRSGRVILTKNPLDFKHLHERFPEHPGILAAYQDNNPTKDMGAADIVRAVGNLESTGATMAGRFLVLNAYRW